MTDVSKPEAIANLAAVTVERYGRIDVWINNAGVGAIGRFEEIPVADHARVIDVNLKGVIYGSHTAMGQFKRQGFGTLVNIGSVESQVPLAYHSTYAASKAGIWSLGRTLNEELRLAGLSRRIKVVTVMPWAADTPYWTHSANYSGRTPRMVAMDDPWDVAEAIVWVSVHPREELPVGWKARASSAAHTIFPDLTERVAADIAHREQMRKAPPAPDTTGNLYQPMEEGRGAEGGARQRIRQEDRQREAAESGR